MPVLWANNITKKYGGRTIIENISLKLNAGELVCLLGVSGIGKSTLFGVLSGLVTPESGSVILCGEDITGKPGHIGYMQQKDLLLPYKTVMNNVCLPLIIRGMKKKEAREKANPLFKTFGLDGNQDKYPVQLSGGMRQRAALLRTYLFGGKAALLDEPFSALDAITKSAMHRFYLDIMEKIKLPTIFITHDIDEAILISDRIYIMSGPPGRISSEIVISEKKPRSADFSVSNEFLDYKKEIIRKLN
ncbi:MAG TPA: ABC transporter ATP-binding protein [Ruminiclostridium sp.]|nr:ABC transporter ATP-binding protein [Ruminiclostridium sp.]